MYWVGPRRGEHDGETATAPDAGVRKPATSASPLTIASAPAIPISAFGSFMCVR